MTAAKRKISVKEKPIQSIGLFPIAGGKVDFLPAIVFDKYGVHEEKRYSFTLRPYTVEERGQIEADNEMMQAKGSLWARDNNIDMKLLNDPAALADPKNALSMVAMTNAFSSFSNRSLRSRIIRSCIIGMENFSDDSGGQIPFDESTSGGMTEVQYSLIPDLISRAVGGELSRISYLDGARKLGL